MRLLLSALLLLFAALPLAAAEKARAKNGGPLPAKEAAEGWVRLFDGETTFGWKAEGEVKVAGGNLVVGGGQATTALTTTYFGPHALSFSFLYDGPKTPAPEWLHDNHWEPLPPSGSSVDATYGGSKGAVPVGFRVPAGGKLAVRSLRLKPDLRHSIFNGRDLTGWKEIKTNRTKSRFSVTDKGELHIQDGPGDIQTEGQWKDFVLQIDVFSNGPHLNSGVFFRCLPGQFWSGYEAQIRNQWQGNDRTKPVDYGTGAIYNRQPARKVVSNDKEWFTMTVAAKGKHLAVWVNGYQTADFTDPRPLNESARKGCKVDAGPVSLQGHDRTTDLLFRNIRVAELPAAAAKK